jgi:hypothetical protein
MLDTSIQIAIETTVPSWLAVVSQSVIAIAKSVAPRFGMVERNFFYQIEKTPGVVTSTVECVGPRVDVSAFDLEFTVPVGGFKYGDLNPITNEPFPGGVNKRGSYIWMADKEKYGGEANTFRSRTWSKYSGQTIKKSGFFDQAIRVNFGTGIIPSSVGEKSLQTLADILAVKIGAEIAASIQRTYSA